MSGVRTRTRATALDLRSRHPGQLRSGECCVVIPAYNEELLIGRCIESVIAAGISGRHIYVVDDQSTDATASVVSRYRDVTLLKNTARLGKLGGLQRVIRDCDLVA